MRRLAHLPAVGFVACACAFDSGGVTGSGSMSVGGDSTTGSGGSSDPTSVSSTTAMTGGATTSTTTMAAEESSGDPSGPTEGTSPPESTSTTSTDAETGVDPTLGTSSSSGGDPGSSSGETPFDPYGSCTGGCEMRGECIEFYDDGVEVASSCAPPCTEANECPMPGTGGATPICITFDSGDFCVLDCDPGECPDEMTCYGTQQVGPLCFWD